MRVMPAGPVVELQHHDSLVAVALGRRVSPGAAGWAAATTGISTTPTSNTLEETRAYLAIAGAPVEVEHIDAHENRRL